MQFLSTRAETGPHSFSEAVKVGLAPDGGLFVPSELPDLSQELHTWAGESYAKVCYRFFKRFATDIEDGELESLIAEHPEQQRWWKQLGGLLRVPLLDIGIAMGIQHEFHASIHQARVDPLHLLFLTLIQGDGQTS